MDIVIPTYGRTDFALQHTLRQLHEANVPCTVVVQPQELAAVARWAGPHGVYALPAHVKGISATRDHILHEMPGGDHVCMMDDDLHFAVRREDERDKFRQPQPADIQRMVVAIDDMLRHSPHVSIGAREGGNRVTSELVMNTRMMRVLAYRRSFLKRHHIYFSPMEVMEDFHVTLQILRLGQDCIVCNNWVSNQAGGSDAVGGCSTFRTDELQAENAHRLARLHPGFVKVVKKQTKTAWGGKERTDVVVQWKQARAAGGKA